MIILDDAGVRGDDASLIEFVEEAFVDWHTFRYCPDFDLFSDLDPAECERVLKASRVLVAEIGTASRATQYFFPASSRIDDVRGALISLLSGGYSSGRNGEEGIEILSNPAVHDVRNLNWTDLANGDIGIPLGEGVCLSLRMVSCFDLDGGELPWA